MSGLPPAPFAAVRYEVRKADKLGKVRVDGPHLYSSDPSLAGRELVCGIGTTTVTVATRDGAVVAEHPRAYGIAPTETANPASQLALLCARPGAWGEQQGQKRSSRRAARSPTTRRSTCRPTTRRSRRQGGCSYSFVNRFPPIDPPNRQC